MYLQTPFSFIQLIWITFPYNFCSPCVAKETDYKGSIVWQGHFITRKGTASNFWTFRCDSSPQAPISICLQCLSSKGCSCPWQQQGHSLRPSCQTQCLWQPNLRLGWAHTFDCVCEILMALPSSNCFWFSESSLLIPSPNMSFGDHVPKPRNVCTDITALSWPRSLTAVRGETKARCSLPSPSLSPAAGSSSQHQPRQEGFSQLSSNQPGSVRPEHACTHGLEK